MTGTSSDFSDEDTIRLYPFWLDSPAEWQTIRAIDMTCKLGVPSKKQFLWLSDSQRLARSFLEEEKECPCGKTVPPVWSLKPLDEATKKMLITVNSVSQEHPHFTKRFERLFFQMSLNDPMNAARMKRKEQLYHPPTVDEIKKLDYSYQFKSDPTCCERLRGLRELTQMPWLDRARAINQVAPSDELFDDVNFSFPELFELGVLHLHFPDLHFADKAQHLELAAIMALVNFDAKIFAERPCTYKSNGETLLTRATKVRFRLIWDALQHISPSSAPKLPFPVFWIEFPKHYFEEILENSIW